MSTSATALLIFAGDVNLTSSVTDDLSDVLCPEYYYFRCEVKESIRLSWRIDGTENHRLGPNSKPNEFHEESNFTFYTENVTAGARPSLTSYVSHLFFPASTFDMTMYNITCESNEGNMRIDVRRGECNKNNLY